MKPNNSRQSMQRQMFINSTSETIANQKYMHLQESLQLKHRQISLDMQEEIQQKLLLREKFINEQIIAKQKQITLLDYRIKQLMQSLYGIQRQRPKSLFPSSRLNQQIVAEQKQNVLQNVEKILQEIQNWSQQRSLLYLTIQKCLQQEQQMINPLRKEYYGLYPCPKKCVQQEQMKNPLRKEYYGLYCCPKKCKFSYQMKSRVKQMKKQESKQIICQQKIEQTNIDSLINQIQNEEERLRNKKNKRKYRKNKRSENHQNCESAAPIILLDSHDEEKFAALNEEENKQIQMLNSQNRIHSMQEVYQSNISQQQSNQQYENQPSQNDINQESVSAIISDQYEEMQHVQTSIRLINEEQRNQQNHQSEDDPQQNEYQNMDQYIRQTCDNDSSDQQSTQPLKSRYQESYQQTKQHILSNHLGKGEYNLPQPQKQWIKTLTFNSIQDYLVVVTKLLLYEIINDVNKRIKDKAKQIYQDKIYIRLKKHTKYRRINKSNKFLKVQEIQVNPSDKKQKLKLQSTMMQGQRLGILMNKRRIPFKTQYLTLGHAQLCFLQYKLPYYQYQQGQIDYKLIGLQNTNISQHQTYVFIDLNSVISHARQYFALNVIQKTPYMSKFITGKDWQQHQKQRMPNSFNKQYNQILDKLQKKIRNDSQFNFIKKISTKQRGLYLLQGPPGTGKTKTIINYASIMHNFLTQIKNPKQDIPNYLINEFQQQQLSRQRNRYTKEVIMICAQSNAAVNHICRQMLKNGLIGNKQMPTIIRIGDTQECDDLLLSVTLSHMAQVILLKREKSYCKSKAQLRRQKQKQIDLIQKLAAQKCETEQKKLEKKQLIKQQKQKLYQIIQQILRINELIKSKFKEYQKIKYFLLWQSEIVLSTLNNVGNQKYFNFFTSQNSKSIKCLIIDEASQATEPSTLIPMSLNPQICLLVGDHQQLQPTVISQNKRQTFYNRSLFQRLIRAGRVPDMLKFQYRMVNQLKYFSNRWFYDRQLQNAGKVVPPESLADVAAPSIFFDIAYGKQENIRTSFFNQAQSKCVVSLVRRLLKKDKKLTIGVICPYKSQENSISDMVQQEYKDRCTISTVDAFQGQQRDIIILTCVRANDRHELGFMNDYRRMNVSLTRAKYCLFVFGNSYTFENNFLWDKYFNYHSNKNTFVHIEDERSANRIIRQWIPL